MWLSAHKMSHQPNKRFSNRHKNIVNEDSLRDEELLEKLTATPKSQPVLEGWMNKHIDRLQFKNPSFIALRKYAEEYCAKFKTTEQRVVPNLLIQYDDVNQLGQQTTNTVKLKFDFLINPAIDNIRNVSLSLDYLQATLTSVAVDTKPVKLEEEHMPVHQLVARNNQHGFA